MKKILISLLVVSSLVLGLSVSQVAAQGMTLSQLVELFISLGIIPSDKVTAARSVIFSSNQVGILEQCYSFDKNLTVGSTGADVDALQKSLITAGVDYGKGTAGVFDEYLAEAVVKFQAKYSIPQTGYVGPLTRAKLNSLCVPTSPNTNTPTCSLTSDKTSYSLGDVITYSWTSQNATYAAWQQDTSGKDHLWLPGDKLPPNGSQTVKANVVGNPSVTLSVAGYDSTGSCTKSVNITSTASSPITVISPNGGEMYLIGADLNIKWWDNSDAGNKNILITDLKHQGSEYMITYDTFMRSSGIDGNYSKLWNTKSLPAGQYKIQVCKSTTNECDFSDNYFTLAPATNPEPPITITSPTGGAYTLGDQMGVKWSTSNYSGSEVDVIVRAANTPEYIAADAGAQTVRVLNTGSYTWTFSNLESGKYYVRIACVPFTAGCYKDSGVFTVNGLPTANSTSVYFSIDGLTRLIESLR